MAGARFGVDWAVVNRYHRFRVRSLGARPWTSRALHKFPRLLLARTVSAGQIMKRIITTIVFALVVPAVAAASRVATGGTRIAIDRAAAPQLPPGIPERCLLGQVTTKDGGNWATVGFNGPHYRSCGRWGFNGVIILRRIRGRWHYVTAGSALLPCGRFGIPVAVRQDLHLPCGAAP